VAPESDARMQNDDRAAEHDREKANMPEANEPMLELEAVTTAPFAWLHL
jgi:hypothetical protein